MSPPARGLFVTGTDTGIGKTHTAAALVAGLARRGYRAAGMKPVASGCERDGEGRWRNNDALILQQSADRDWPYEWINPYALPEPVAPHIAADLAGIAIDPDEIRRCYERLAAASDVVVVEGVGGWRVPLARDVMTADLVRSLGMPVLLVVGLRLGCINHALLTAEALCADGLPMLGWVANALEPEYATTDATLALLRERIAAPLLGKVGHDDPDHAALLARIEYDLALR